MMFRGFVREEGVGVRNYVAVICTVGCAAHVVRKIVEANPRAKAIIHHQGCCHVPPEISHVEKVLINLALNPNVHSALFVSLGCEGGSDFTSGIVSNPVAGKVADLIIDNGGTVIFGETTEVIGAEHIVARRAASKEVAQKLYKAVESMEQRVIAMGVDMRKGQPTPGNIRGGITTIEEKSIGAVCKAGSSKLIDVVDYGDIVKERGLIFMDTPGRELEVLTGFAAGGAQITLFTTGLGVPQGYPIMPVVKISGNPETCKKLSEHIDVDLSKVFYGEESIEAAAKRVLNEILEVASSKKTKAELLGYEDTVEIYVRGPVI